MKRPLYRAGVLDRQEPGSGIPAGGLTTRLLRQLRLGYDVRSLGEIVRAHPSLERLGLTADALAGTPPRRPTHGRGRPALPAHSYATLAAAYAAAVSRGSKRPVQELAAQSGEPIARIRSRIQTARRLGFLDRGVQGNAGGKLTAAAKKVLKQKKGRHGKTTRSR